MSEERKLDSKEIQILEKPNPIQQQEKIEIAKPRPFPLELFEIEVAKLIPQSGTIQLTDEQKKVLYAPINEEDIEIRPDGLIYLPWMEYVTRLNRAFGLEWAIIPQSMPRLSPGKNSIIWGFYLVIQGKLAGFAIGEQEYHPDNPRMNWSDACEGAKSNALMRLCKGLGIGLELWKPSFIRAWREKYAEQYIDEKNRVLWRKRGTKSNDQFAENQNIPHNNAIFDQEPNNSFKAITLTLSDGRKIKHTYSQAISRFQNIKKAIGENNYYEILGQFGYEHANEIPPSKMPQIFDVLIKFWKEIGDQNESR